MKYPLDKDTANEFLSHLFHHETALRGTIKELTAIVDYAMQDVESNVDEGSEPDWYNEAKDFLKKQKQLHVEHENRKFDLKNAMMSRGMKIEDPMPMPVINTSIAPIQDEGHETVRLIPQMSQDINNVAVAAQLNKYEAQSGGGEMDEEELARHFGERVARKKKTKPINKMTMEELEQWEEDQDNSNDIYKVAARVKNLARGGGGALTPHGEMMANTFVHVLMALYNFAETIEDRETKIKLIKLVRSNENMPANLIAATKSGLKG